MAAEDRELEAGETPAEEAAPEPEEGARGAPTRAEMRANVRAALATCRECGLDERGEPMGDYAVHSRADLDARGIPWHEFAPRATRDDVLADLYASMYWTEVQVRAMFNAFASSRIGKRMIGRMERQLAEEGAGGDGDGNG